MINETEYEKGQILVKFEEFQGYKITLNFAKHFGENLSYEFLEQSGRYESTVYVFKTEEGQEQKAIDDFFTYPFVDWAVLRNLKNEDIVNSLDIAIVKLRNFQYDVIDGMTSGEYDNGLEQVIQYLKLQKEDK